MPREDARYLLPNAAETQLVCTFNARSLYNFFRLRCCQRAQWEIRVPGLPDEGRGAAGGAGAVCPGRPSCETEGIRWEGDLSCGRADDIRRREAGDP